MSEVIQADRDAAAVLFDRVSRASWNSETDPHSEAAQHILRGDGDGSPFVQALAAHRIAHLPNTDLSEERAKEVLAEYAPSDHDTCYKSDALRAMQQYAAGLQGEVDELKRQIEGLRLAGRHGAEALRRATEGGCDLCAGECRGHSLGHPEEWIPEPGSRSVRTALGDTQ